LEKENFLLGKSNKSPVEKVGKLEKEAGELQVSLETGRTIIEEQKDQIRRTIEECQLLSISKMTWTRKLLLLKTHQSENKGNFCIKARSRDISSCIRADQ